MSCGEAFASKNIKWARTSEFGCQTPPHPRYFGWLLLGLGRVHITQNIATLEVEAGSHQDRAQVIYENPKFA